MGNLAGFNANDHEPNSGFELIPPGDYEACIVASELKPTKKGDGNLLEIQVSIINGPHQNRKLIDRLNINNPSEDCQRIGRGTLSAICLAVGKDKPTDSSELHMLSLCIKVGTRKRQDTGDIVNVIKSYKPCRANSLASVQASVAVGAGTAKSSAPWLAS
jgi:hypothetical protein